MLILFVKDESYRFSLYAFKVLGGSYAMAKYVAQQTGKTVEDVPYDVSTKLKRKIWIRLHSLLPLMVTTVEV